MKKILTVSLLFLGSMSSAFAFSPSIFTFSDIDGSDFEDYIKKAHRQNIISGYDDGTFRPNAPVSYIESLKIVLNTGPHQDLVQEPDESVFDNWWNRYKTFYEQHQQTNKVNFENNEKITRDFAVYLVLKQLGMDLDSVDASVIPAKFSDVNPSMPLAPYIYFAKYTGVINGYTWDTFGPKNKVSRGELTKMVWNALRKNKTKISKKYSELAQRVSKIPMPKTAIANPHSFMGDTPIVLYKGGNIIVEDWIQTPVPNWKPGEGKSHTSTFVPNTAIKIREIAKNEMPYNFQSAPQKCREDEKLVTSEYAGFSACISKKFKELAPMAGIWEETDFEYEGAFSDKVLDFDSKKIEDLEVMETFTHDGHTKNAFYSNFIYEDEDNYFVDYQKNGNLLIVDLFKDEIYRKSYIVFFHDGGYSGFFLDKTDSKYKRMFETIKFIPFKEIE